jgi:hypothetical protein
LYRMRFFTAEPPFCSQPQLPPSQREMPETDLGYREPASRSIAVWIFVNRREA